ncbi:zinc finger protein 570-like [Ctenocephalides felis]|uniref:zinc finger protein 570-like n=1 Tax=Ctenocephalides felis TaxID=7515 RepID=UPI000E6E137A|nr:zinc finger protein 570-like [Ctenocephalides felis]
MSEETNSNKTIKIEPIDDYPQVKQEFDDYENTSDLCMYNDDICLQQFLKSEVTIDEEIKQETFDEQDASANTNQRVLDEKHYKCNEEITNSSNLMDSTNKSIERVSEKRKTTSKLKRYECEICHKSFVTKQNLKQHGIIHTGERPHECKICNKRFTQSNNLRKHSSVHNEERPYFCKICHEEFKGKQNLNQHKMIHIKKRPYNCVTCNKIFTRKYILTRHEMIHTGQRPYECIICNKRFSESGNLRQHLSVHIGERPYNCEICNKTFKTKSILNQHKLVHTGK